MTPLDPDLVTALDKMMRSDLDGWSSLWFWILVGSTIAVAIGIVAEAPEVWKEIGLGRETVIRIRKWWYLRVRRIDLNGWEKLCPELITRNESRRRWIVKAAFVGWVLVAAGVAGEGIAEYFVNESETNIRAFDEADVKEAQDDAGRAIEFASLNELEAAKLREKAGDETTARVTLQGKVADAQARVEELRKANNEAATALGQEQTKRLQLAASLLPRAFWDQSGAISALQNLPAVKVVFEFADETEIRNTAEQINFVVTASHWTSSRRHCHEYLIREGVTISAGMGVMGDSPFDKRRLAEQVIPFLVTMLLEHSDIDAKRGLLALKLPTDTILISVGQKPYRAAEETIKELARPPATAVQLGSVVIRASGNRAQIRDDHAVPCKE